jgi:starvation-inducible DNA-binding protein
MSTEVQTGFPRNVLKTDDTNQVASLLQQNLLNLIDLSLLLKQAHWNVVGRNFRSVHLQLDEIIETTRDASDEVAERVSTVGVAPDGRSATVAQGSELVSYPQHFVTATETVERCADALKATIDRLRSSISQLGDLDPISEDMLIGISAGLEKHLWMLQAQEVGEAM